MTTAAQHTYLMVLAVPAYRVDATHFAIESAFVYHLRMLKEKLGSLAKKLVLASPFLTDQDFETRKENMIVVDEDAEGIHFAGMFSVHSGRLQYLRELPQTMRALLKEVRAADFVHAGHSNIYRMFEFPSLLIGRALGKQTIAVTDIDFRGSARMNYATGRWTKREYLMSRFLHSPIMHLEHLVTARLCSLVLLKGASLARDYGSGRANVKNFLDSAYSSEHIIPQNQLDEKVSKLLEGSLAINITYFGRLIQYKGIDHMLRALARAKDLGLKNFTFQIVGNGEAESELRKLTKELQLENEVTFHGAVPFGDKLFKLLYSCHILLAAPLSEDTPRSALDAMASGQAIVAYDTYYYRELMEAGAGIDLVPWNDYETLGQKLYQLCSDRPRLARSIENSAKFTQDNTQEIWLDRRVNWTKELIEQ